MSNQNALAGQEIEKEGLDVFERSPDISEISFGNPAESRVVIENGIVGFDERVVDNLRIGRHDRDTSQLATFRGVAHLAIHRVDTVVAASKRLLIHRANEPINVPQVLYVRYMVFCRRATF